MRISTAQLYDSATTGILRNQSNLAKLQNQLSTGQKLITPSDDPVAAEQVIITTQQQGVNAQFSDNQKNASDQIAFMETRLGAVTDTLTQIQETLVQAGNGSYTDADRQALAANLQQRFDELLGLANSADAEGNYLFAGYKSTTQPFANNNGNVTYQGGEGVRQLQVNANRTMDVSAAGDNVFMNVWQGAGNFPATSAGAANAGTGVVSPGAVSGTYDGKRYNLSITGPGAYSVTTFDPVTGTTSAPSAGAFVSGTPFTLGGVSITITGAPAVGDTFTMQRSQSLFQPLNDIINGLRSGLTNTTKQANFTNLLQQVSANVQQSMDNVMNVRTTAGAALNELDTLNSTAQTFDLQYKETLSNLQDLDYAQAISDMSRQQLSLQAAQQSFVKVTGLSLFNYLS